MAGDTVTIPQGDFVTCGVTPNLLDSGKYNMDHSIRPSDLTCS